MIDPFSGDRSIVALFLDGAPGCARRDRSIASPWRCCCSIATRFKDHQWTGGWPSVGDRVLPDLLLAYDSELGVYVLFWRIVRGGIRLAAAVRRSQARLCVADRVRRNFADTEARVIRQRRSCFRTVRWRHYSVSTAGPRVMSARDQPT